MIKEYSPIKKKNGIKNFLSLSTSQNARTCLCIAQLIFKRKVYLHEFKISTEAIQSLLSRHSF